MSEYIGEIIAEHTGTEGEIMWKIPDFLSLAENSYGSEEMFQFLNLDWDLEIEPYESNSKNYVALHLKYSDCEPCYVKTTFGIKDADDLLIEVISFKHTFCETNPRLVVHRFLNRNVLCHNRSVLLPSNELTIVCKLEKLEDPVKDPVREDSAKLTGKDLLLENIKSLLTDESFCDIILNVKDKEFKAHKNILAARSPVFAAMFKHETSEKQTGIVHISDCDPESFPEFLEYLYCGKLENISFRSAFYLYKTAHKYDIQDLNRLCAKHLEHNLEMEYIFDVVVLADEYEEKALQDAVQNFFNKNFHEILITTAWKNFMKSHFNLGNKLLIEMSSNVMIFGSAEVEIRED